MEHGRTDRARPDPTTVYLISSALIGLLCWRDVRGDIKGADFAALQITGYRVLLCGGRALVGKRQIIHLNILI